MLYNSIIMRKVRLPLIALLLAGLVLTQASRWSATPAFAQTALVATQDTFVDPNNPTTAYDGKRLELAYSNFPTLLGTRRTLLQFNLTGIPDSLSTAPLLLTMVENNFPAGATLTLGLYGLADNWNEAAVTFATLPTVSTQLQTISVVAGTTGEIRFSAAAIGAYLEAQRAGDGVASFLLRIDDGSGTLGFGGNLFFEDSEGSSDGVNGNEPVIEAPATVPTATLTNTTVPPTATSTNTPTGTTVPPTATSTNTPTGTTVPPTATSTNTPTGTTVPPTATSTNTPTGTTVPPTATSTNIPTGTTVPPTATPTNTPTNTTVPATATSTNTPTNTTVPATATSTNTTVPATATSTNTSTNTTVPPTATSTNTPTGTTVSPTATSTNIPTGTTVPPTATPTNTPTNTTVPPTATSTNTPTGTTVPATATSTNTPTNTTVPPTATPTSTPTGTPTSTPTNTAVPPTATNTPASTGCDAVPGNLVRNGNFEDGTVPWQFYTGSSGSFSATSPAHQCEKAAHLQINGSNSNVQLYQRGITLQAGKQYQLSFAAYSSNGHDLSVFMHDHRSPYTNYGLQTEATNLTTGWQQFSITFVASGFGGTVTDARLRFWLAPYAQAGDLYWIDDVRLTEVGGSSPTATPTPINTPDGPTPIPTNTPISGSCVPVADNLINNGDFETGSTAWYFFTNSSGSFTTQEPAYSCDNAARIQADGTGSNVQLYQRGLRLEANTDYRLTFAAYSSSGADLGLYLHNHNAPYQNYGLNINQVNLGTGWQFYTVNFTTAGFSGAVTDARLRFWLAPYARSTDVYWIDAVSIVKVSGRSSGSDEPVNGPIVVTTTDGLLIGLTELEFDPIVLGAVADGNDVGALLEQRKLFLPFVTR